MATKPKMKTESKKGILVSVSLPPPLCKFISQKANEEGISRSKKIYTILDTWSKSESDKEQQ